MKAKVVKLVYTKGFYQSSNGNKKKDLQFGKADKVWTNRNGFYKLRANSKYELFLILDNGKKHTIDIKHMLGDKNIRLIERRRKIIEDNLPDYIEMSSDGNSLIKQSFDEWFNKLQLD